MNKPLIEYYILRLPNVLLTRSAGIKQFQQCVSNHQNAYFDELPFDYDQMLITRKWIYGINDNNVYRLKNGFIIDVYTHLIDEE